MRSTRPTRRALELPDLEAAEVTGLASARAVAAEHVYRGRLTLSHRIEIADATGAVLKTIRFDDAVEVLGCRGGGDPVELTSE
jgi:hypothetical protein